MTAYEPSERPRIMATSALRVGAVTYLNSKPLVERLTDFAPWYTKAEKLYSVHGERGIDPTDPPGDPYPHPPVSHEPRIQEVVDDIKKTGLHPFPLPVGIRLDEQTKKALVDVELTERGYGSLRRDTFCESRPQSPIGEYFLDCLPGESRGSRYSTAVLPPVRPMWLRCSAVPAQHN